MPKQTRRQFIKTIPALAVTSVFAALPLRSLAGRELAGTRAAGPIREVFLDLANIHKWNLSNGDTWDPFWADDGGLYSFNCDGRGFGRLPRNLAFNQLSGSSLDTLTEKIVNTMDDYGVAGQKGPDRATWKACGQECIDSVFYAFVSRNVYGNLSGDPLLRQTAFNSSLIKSTDRGATWTRSAAENYRKPMWPGKRFGAPFFVHYGQNGGSVAQDAADQYIYVVSTNGFWNDGDNYILARIKRAKLAGLNPSDWTYYAGGDGEQPHNWSTTLAEAVPILSLPAQCGQTPPCFIAGLGVYLMAVWYNRPVLRKWFAPREMIYEFYQAPHPWGPWTFITRRNDRFIIGGHMYGPSLCAKYQERNAAGIQATMFTSGCPFQDVPSGLYKMWEIPLILRTTPLPPAIFVSAGDPPVVYRGTWQARRDRGLRDSVHYSRGANDSLEFSFTGTGIEYLAEKDSRLGGADVYLDGRFARNVSLRLEDFPPLSQVVVFGVQGLNLGRHTLRIGNNGPAPIVLDGFRVYGVPTQEGVV
jgi:hypothetical protein